MQITIDLSTLIVVCGALSAAAGAAYWAFRRVDDVGKIPALHRAVNGDPDEQRDSKIRLGIANRTDQIESAVAALAVRVAGIQRGLEAHGSQERPIAEGVRRSIAAIVGDVVNERTGSHPAIGWSEQLPPPAAQRRPALGVPREDPPDSDHPPPRRRRDGGE